MDNTARKIIPIEEYRIKFDISEYENEIRKDEREKQIARMKRIRSAAKANLIDYMIQKVIGLVFVFGSIIICNSTYTYNPLIDNNDGTFALFVVPLGLFMLFTNKHLFRDGRFENKKSKK